MKLKATFNSPYPFGTEVDVFLNGKKVEYPLAADEEAGMVWALYQDARGEFIPAVFAEPGALTAEGYQIIELRGRVELRSTLHIRATLEAAYDPDMFVPLVITRVPPLRRP